VSSATETSNSIAKNRWSIASDQQHAPMLVAFICPHCEHTVEPEGD
jgi:hypothetical protein